MLITLVFKLKGLVMSVTQLPEESILKFMNNTAAYFMLSVLSAT